LRNSPGWVALHARRTGTLGVKYFGWCKIILILDVLGRLPAEFPSGRLGVVDPVENVRADETGVASVLGISEVSDRRGGIADEFGVGR
jgi:hypothetical protein